MDPERQVYYFQTSEKKIQQSIAIAAIITPTLPIRIALILTIVVLLLCSSTPHSSHLARQAVLFRIRDVVLLVLCIAQS